MYTLYDGHVIFVLNWS